MKLKLKYFDPADITTFVNKGTGKHVISDGFTTIPIYKGKLYSIKDVVNKDGTVNVRKAKQIMEEVAEYFGGKKMQNRPENPVWHKDDPNTWLHTKKVALNAWQIPVPEGYTKQDLMIAALGHDFGKILSGDGHAEVSYNLLKLIFPDATEKQLNAIRRHMDDLGTHTDVLETATKFADLGVTPIADLTTLGLTPEELEIVKLTKWFKKGGHLIKKHLIGKVLEKINPIEIFKKRATSKGIDEAVLNEIKKFNLKSEKGRLAAAEYIAALDGLSGKLAEEVIELYKEFFKNSSKKMKTGASVEGAPVIHSLNLDSKYKTELLDSHEMYHNVMPECEEVIPDEAIVLEDLLDFREGSENPLYFIEHNNNEVAARISQVLTANGVTDARKISGKELKNMFDNYINNSDNLQNDVAFVADKVKDWDALAKWASNPRNVLIAPAVIAGAGTLATLQNNTSTLKKGGILIPKNISGGILEAAIKFLKEGFGGTKAVQRLAGQTGFGNDKKFLQAAAESLEKISEREGGTVQEVMDLFPFEDLREDILLNMVKPETKVKGGSPMKATIFSPKDTTILPSNLFGDSVSIDLRNLTKLDRTSKNKLDTILPINQAEGKHGLGFNGEPLNYTISTEERSAGHVKNGSSTKGKLTPVFYIDDKELSEFKKQILAPTAELRGADPNQVAFIKQVNTAGIVEKAPINNLTIDHSSYGDGFARISKASDFDRASGDKIKSMLIHENLGHGLEHFLEDSYINSFDKNLIKGEHKGDTRAILMEAKFFLWKEAKRIAKKDNITPEELNEFISKVPNSELKELFTVLNHLGAGNKGTGTSIALNFMKNPKQYKDILGKMLGVTAVAGSAGIAAAALNNEIPAAKNGMKFQEGRTIIEEKPFYEQIAELPIFRHLPNRVIAELLDEDLNNLFKRKRISYGLLDEESEINLQKKYNLTSELLKETLDDLFNNGLGASLIMDIPEILENDENDLLFTKEGGILIPKFANPF